MVRGFLILHIAGGALAIIAGYAALAAPKGGWLHRRAGLLFVGSMLAMGAGAMVVGLARGLSTWLGGPFVAYLVITALTTVRRGVSRSPRLDLALTGVALALAVTSLIGGVRAASSPPGALAEGGVPASNIAVASFMNGTVLLLAVIGDLRVRRDGALTGSRRIARHLWRMCYAMFMATGSFFLGQPRFIPEPLRPWPIRIALAVLPLLALFYWLWRVRRRRGGVVTRLTARAPVPTGVAPSRVVPS